MFNQMLIPFLVFLAAADLCLVGLICYWLFFQTPRREKQLSDLRDSLQLLVSESDRSIEQFQASLKQDQNTMERLVEEARTRERSLRTLLRDAESLIFRLERERFMTADGETSMSADYDTVLRLAAGGASISEISKETGIPENQIKLLLDVRK